VHRREREEPTVLKVGWSVAVPDARGADHK